MSTKPSIDVLLEDVAPERREALRKVLSGAAVGAVVYAAPLIASFSMEDLGGVAQAQVSNQVVPTPIPTTSKWSLAAMAGLVAAAGAALLRRRPKI